MATKKKAEDLEPLTNLYLDAARKAKNGSPDLEPTTVWLRKSSKNLFERIQEAAGSKLELSPVLDGLLLGYVSERVPGHLSKSDAAIDFKSRILDLLRVHPIKNYPDEVYNVFIDYGSSLAIAKHGDRAEDIWNLSFKISHAIQKVGSS